MFYIYDSRVRNTIQKITPRISGIPAISEQVYDKEYRSFCRRAQWLREKIQERFHVDLTPRQLDKMLLKIEARA